MFLILNRHECPGAKTQQRKPLGIASGKSVLCHWPATDLRDRLRLAVLVWIEARARVGPSLSIPHDYYRHEERQ